MAELEGDDGGNSEGTFLDNRNNLIIAAVVVLAIVGGFLILNNQQTEQMPEPTQNQQQQQQQQQQTDQTNQVLATVNGEEITQEQVSQIQQSARPRQVSQDQALESAINREILYQKAEEGGHVPTTQEAEQELRDRLAERNSSLQELKQQVKSRGQDYQAQLENYKRQLAIQRYLDEALKGEVENVTEQEARDFYESYKNQSQREVPPFAQIKPQIISRLEQQKRQQAIQDLLSRLKSEFDIQYNR